MAKRIVTHHVCPPIPVRDFDWRAYLDGYEPGDPMGEGPTEDAAVADLLAQLGDGADTAATRTQGGSA